MKELRRRYTLLWTRLLHYCKPGIAAFLAVDEELVSVAEQGLD